MKKPKRLFKNRPPVESVRTKTPPIDVNRIEFIALHEAGHAVSGAHFGLGLEFVDIKRRTLPDGSLSLGYTKCRVPIDAFAGKGRDAALPWMVQCLAGPVAESLANPNFDALKSAGVDDGQNAHRIAIIAICPSLPVVDGQMEIPPDVHNAHKEEIDALLNDAMDATTAFVGQFQNAIIDVADALVESRELSADQVIAIVREHQHGSTAV
jgi:hypothetical protein